MAFTSLVVTKRQLNSQQGQLLIEGVVAVEDTNPLALEVNIGEGYQGGSIFASLDTIMAGSATFDVTLTGPAPFENALIASAIYVQGQGSGVTDIRGLFVGVPNIVYDPAIMHPQQGPLPSSFNISVSSSEGAGRNIIFQVRLFGPISNRLDSRTVVI